MADKPLLAAFLAAAHGVHVYGAGTKETSYYTALDNLLDGRSRANRVAYQRRAFRQAVRISHTPPPKGTTGHHLVGRASPDIS